MRLREVVNVEIWLGVAFPILEPHIREVSMPFDLTSALTPDAVELPAKNYPQDLTYPNTSSQHIALHAA